MSPTDNVVRERKRAAPQADAAKAAENVPEKEPEEKVPSEKKPRQRSVFRQRLRIFILICFFASLSLYIAQLFGYFLPKEPRLRQVARTVEDLANYVPDLPSPSEVVTAADPEKRDAIVRAFREAWNAYEADAFGADEYHPISHTGTNLSVDGGIGYMIVDALDTIVMMGLDEEYERAKEWCRTQLSFDRTGELNVFEVTIRVLGGLLSAHALTADPLYVTLSRSLADRLLPAFRTPSGIPTSSIDLRAGEGIRDKDNRGLSGTAEATTLQLEFKYLAELTGEEEYWRTAERVMGAVRRALRTNVVPIFMNVDTGDFYVSQVRLGSRGDSYYEYLLKQYLQTSRTELLYREMYDAAMTEVDQYLIHRTVKSNLTFTAEMHPTRGPQGEVQWRIAPKQDHLACFLAGSLLLRVTEGQQPVPPDTSAWTMEDKRDWRNGVELIRTCMATHETATGLPPEIAMFNTEGHPRAAFEDWYVKHAPDGSAILDGRYILRPETIESLFFAFRVTGDQKYRDWGWQIFQSIEKHCKLPNGAYASVMDVETLPVTYENKMETFMMSETLKYLFLLFSDASVFPLHEWVFNTEAHPLPVFTPSFKTGIV